MICKRKIRELINILDKDEDALLIGLLEEKIDEKTHEDHLEYLIKHSITPRELKYTKTGILRKSMPDNLSRNEQFAWSFSEHRKKIENRLNSPEFEMIVNCKAIVNKMKRKCNKLIDKYNFPNQI